MSRPNWCPPHFHWLTPYLTVRQVEASCSFYQQAFGFALGQTMPGSDGQTAHAELHYQGQVIVMFAPEGAFGGNQRAPSSSGGSSPVSLYVYVADVDALVHQARAAGAAVLSEPADTPWGDRMAQLRDINGYDWTFATHLGTEEIDIQ